MKFLVIICSMLLLLSTHSTTLAEDVNFILQPKQERVSDFSAFIKKFYYDMAFQKERVVFPCTAKFEYTPDDKPYSEVFTKRSWVAYDRNKELGIET